MALMTREERAKSGYENVVKLFYILECLNNEKRRICLKLV